jgi:large subunit ribosomal protein L28e
MTHTISSCSPDITWMCIKNSSSFLRNQARKTGVVLTAEPMNLTQKNSRKYSGLANRRGISIEQQVVSDKKEEGSSPRPTGIRLQLKTHRHTKSPMGTTKPVSLTRGIRRACRSIINETARKHIRPDLKRVSF